MDSQADWERKLLCGDLDVEELPPRKSRTIKLFVCCNQSDSVQERDVLVREVYPKLREYCRQKHGVEFHAIDLHWGVEESEWPDHSYSEFVLTEIERCQQLSAGPNFLAILGQRYGNRPLPCKILVEDFEALRRVLAEHRGRESREAPLLDVWYRRDNNAIPPQMVLQPITSEIPDYNCEDNALREAAEEQWLATSTQLRQLLQLAAKLCVQKQCLEPERCRYYIASEMEAELRSGLDSGYADGKPRALAFHRTITDLCNYLSHPAASKFIEVLYNPREERLIADEDSRDMLRDLLNFTLNQSLPEQNVHRTSVLWRFDTGINPSLDMHRRYLSEFCELARTSLERLVDAHSDYYREEQRSEISEEVLRHWELARENIDGFWGQEELLDTIRSYLISSSDEPLVIHGVPGSGKTTILSRAATLIKSWFADNDVLVICRFLGLTPNSSDIRQVIYDICYQIALVQDGDVSLIPNDYKELLKYFHGLLANYPENKNLVIMFDSVEKLSADHNAHYMNWVPNTLTENVKFVIAADPEKHKIVERLKTELIRNPDNLVEMCELGSDQAVDLLFTWLNEVGRTLTTDQVTQLRTIFNRCSLPMYVRLLYFEVFKWNSYSTIDFCGESTLSGYIHALFHQLELSNGRPLISRILSYLTASATGLSDLELEDLLSLDETVLDQIFTTYHPAVRRLPPLCLSRVMHRLAPLLTLREADGVTVYTWKHALFSEITTSRYLADERFVKEIHNCLSDYFLGNWAYNPKPFQYSAEMIKQLKIEDTSAKQAADRLVPLQPLTFTDEDGKVRFNKRKYDQVPRQLYLAGRLDELNQLVTFNYDWFYNKTKAMSLQHILNDIAINKTTEAQLIVSALRAAQPVMAVNVNNMAAELSGRLLPYYQSHPAIRDLIRMCDHHGLKQSCFVPAYPYYQVPGSTLQYTMECPNKIECFGFTNDYRNLLTKSKKSTTIQVIDLATGELKDPIEATSGDMYVTPNASHLVLVDHEHGKTVKIHKFNGDFVGQLIPMNHFEFPRIEKYKLNLIDVSDNTLCLTVTTEKSFVFIADIPTCKFIQMIPLDARATVCKMTPDARFLMVNSAESLLCYNLEAIKDTGKIAPLCTTQLTHRPTQLLFSKDGSRAFLINTNEPKVMVIHVKDGYVDLSYKVVLEDFLRDDPIREVKLSHKEDRLLLRADTNLAIYDFMSQQVVCHLSRPQDMPPQFRLPKDVYHDIVFKQADFTRDDTALLFAIFRNVYIWELKTSKILTSLQAPIGIIDEMYVSTSSNQIITHLHNSNLIHTWDLNCISTIGLLDSFTGAVNDVKMTYSDFAAFVSCSDSDEIGAIDMRTGQMVELLTHESPVQRFAVTPDGAYVFVSCKATSALNGVNKIWQLMDRKVVYEFGQVLGYPVALNSTNTIFNVAQSENHFKAPYYITQFNIKEENVEQTVFAHTINYVMKPPFVTENDKFLVIQASEDYIESKLHHVRPYVCAFVLEDTIMVKIFGASELNHMVNGKRILDVRPCPSDPNRVLVLYTLVENELDGVITPISAHNHLEAAAEPEGRNYDATPDGLQDGSPRLDQEVPPSDYVGLLVIDLTNFTVPHVCDSFLTPDVPVDDSLLFSRDMRLCLDARSYVYDVETGQRLLQLHPAALPPRRLMLDGRVALFYENEEILALRVDDGAELGRCCVHGQVCHVHVCHDERTLLVGTTDGQLLSYTVLLDEQDTGGGGGTEALLGTILSRQLQPGQAEPDAPLQGRISAADGRQSRSWDRVASGDTSSYRRDSAYLAGTLQEKSKLNRIKPVNRFRPKSDTQLYLNSSSKSCSIM